MIAPGRLWGMKLLRLSRGSTTTFETSEMKAWSGCQIEPPVTIPAFAQ